MLFETLSTNTAPVRVSNSLSRIKSFQQALLLWFDAQKRDLPWRQKKGLCDAERHRQAYRVWVSEIMLQQTQVKTVIPYFERWMAAFPTLTALSEASEEEVLQQWEGLGYYRRARYLHESAQYVTDELHGVIPNNAKDLGKLKGIGPYTAGAIASIAFGERVCAVDGNVIRVISRLFAMEKVQPKKSTATTRIKKELEPILPHDRPGDFNEALMELGATLCKPTSPSCSQCPVTDHCIAYQKGIPEQYPEVGERTPVKKVRAEVAVVSQYIDGTTRFLIEQRQKVALLHGTWQFPMVDHAPSVPHFLTELKDRGIVLKPSPCTYPSNGNLFEDNLLGKVKHKFTHLDMTLSVRLYQLLSLSPISQIEWVSLNEFQQLPVSKAMRKVEKLIRLKLGHPSSEPIP